MAEQETLIGIDLGTSAVKTCLFNTEGHALATSSRTIALYQPQQGVAEQDPDDYVQATLGTIKEVLEIAQVASSSVCALAFDGQMGGAMAIDKDWQALSPWYPSGLDSRYVPYQQEMLHELGDRQLALCGDAPIYAPRIRWWQEEHPELYQNIHKVLILANYVAGKLSQNPLPEGFIDPSYLTWSGLSDTQNRCWSTELIEATGVDRDKLPEIIKSSDVVGQLSRHAAQQCGLIAGTPLVAGAGDQVAGMLGAGLVQAGDLVDVAGTFPVLALCHDSYLADTHYRMLKPLAGPQDDLWYPMMYVNGGGLTHRWFVEQYAAGTSFETLDAEASQLEQGADQLLFIPHFMGRACPVDSNMRGAFLGLSWTHTRAHLYRAVLESIAYDFAVAFEAIRHYLPEANFQQIRVIGGGAKSQLWNQIKADVMGLPYVRLERHNAAPWGAAIIGAYAVGRFSDMTSIAQTSSPVSQLIAPRNEAHQGYQAYVAAYQQALSELRGINQTLAQLRTTASR